MAPHPRLLSLAVIALLTGPTLSAHIMWLPQFLFDIKGIFKVQAVNLFENPETTILQLRCTPIPAISTASRGPLVDQFITINPDHYTVRGLDLSAPVTECDVHDTPACSVSGQNTSWTIGRDGRFRIAVTVLDVPEPTTVVPVNTSMRVPSSVHAQTTSNSSSEGQSISPITVWAGSPAASVTSTTAFRRPSFRGTGALTDTQAFVIARPTNTVASAGGNDGDSDDQIVRPYTWRAAAAPNQIMQGSIVILAACLVGLMIL